MSLEIEISEPTRFPTMSFEALMTAYALLCVGYQGPTHLRVSKGTLRSISQLFMRLNLSKAESIIPNRFCGAEIVEAKELADGVVQYLNLHDLSDPSLNGLLWIEDMMHIGVAAPEEL